MLTPRLSRLLLAAALLFPACKTQTPAPPPPAPPPVSFIVTAPETVTLTTDWVASLDGFVNAQIRPQVPGYLIARTYKEGSVVKKGQVLFEIDPRPFEAVLEQTRARLAEARVQVARAETDLKRDRPLVEQHALPQSQLDTEIHSREAAVAAVGSAQAAVAAAELNLTYTKVTALTGGVAAVATAQIGDLVSPSTLLTTVSQVDPIRAVFPLSEPDYLKIAGRLNGPEGGRRIWSEGAGLRLVLADGSVYPAKGTFFAADREIDPKTGSIRITVTFPNPKGVLRPGQFGRVRADARVVTGAILVPQRAVTEMQGIRSVRVIGEGNKVSVRVVTATNRIDTRWLIEKGLNAGEKVIVDGVNATDGVVVNPSPFQPPAAARPQGAR